MIKRLFVLSVLAIFSPLLLAQNIDPKNDQEYAYVITQCYVEILRDQWKTIIFKYKKTGVNEDGTNKISVSAKFTKDKKEWSEAQSCHPRAPQVITENYLENVKKNNKKFKYLILTVDISGKYTVVTNN